MMVKTYIVHYARLSERKHKLLRLFESNRYTHHTFVDHYDPEYLSRMLFVVDRRTCAILSIKLGHIYIWRQLVESGDEYCLVLEDDALFNPTEFYSTLSKYMDQLPVNWDMLFLGDGCGFHIPEDELSPGKLVYKKGNEPTSWGGAGATRCADSYIIHRSCAERIMEYIRMRDVDHLSVMPLDHWLNILIRDMNMNIYWAEPTLVSQGSETGAYHKSY
jgi:GR25 family glycosyltransferase involved in LPS biosynthesis